MTSNVSPIRRHGSVRIGTGRGGIGLLATVLVISGSCASQVTSPLASPPAETGSFAREPSTRQDESVIILDSYLEERITVLANGSPTWRAAMDTLADTGFKVVIGTPAQVRRVVPGLDRYRPEQVGEVLSLRNDAGELAGAVVVIDVRRLRRMGQAVGLGEESLSPDVDRVLIHELYGHVVPLAQTRRISGGCPDPKPGEPALSSCAITRENRIRAELGWEMRTTYDLQGLIVGRAIEQATEVLIAPEAATQLAPPQR